MVDDGCGGGDELINVCSLPMYVMMTEAALLEKV